MPIPALVRRLGRAIPFSVRERALQQLLRVRAIRSARMIERAQQAPGKLGYADLVRLANEYPVARSPYLYDPDAILRRGEERADEIARYCRTDGRVLEVGAADAMTSFALRQRGALAVALDIDTSLFNRQARDANVHVLGSDAGRMCFPDNCFDTVFSYNTFEHLPDPPGSLAEIIRVLRPGGRAYISFAGLGWSPHGAHMYKEIGIPYVTVLFEEATIQRYLHEHGLNDTFPWVNNCSVERFRDAFAAVSGRVQRLRYRETRNYYHLAIIERYPEQFRRAPSFDSLLVDSVEFVFEKR